MSLRKDDRYKRASYRTFNAKLPGRYDSMFWHSVFDTRGWDQEIVSLLSPDLASLQVLDVGCATGRLLLSLAEAGAQHLYGTDLAPGIIEVAKGKLHLRYPAVEFQVADAEETLPWEDGRFDVATLTAAFHHFYRPADALKEIHRVLRSGGRIIIVDPWFVPVVRHVLNAYLRVFDHDGDCRFYSRSELTRLLAANGFPTILDNRRISRLSYLVVGQKAGMFPNPAC